MLRHLISWRRMILTVAVTLFCGGCGGSDNTTEAAPDKPSIAAKKDPPGSTSPKKGNDKREKINRLRGKSPDILMLRTAIAELELTDQQRSEIKALMPRKKRTPRNERREQGESFRQALAQSVKKGVADPKVYRSTLEKGRDLTRSREAQGVEAMNKLHALLSPEQRTALASRVEQDLEEIGKQEARKAAVEKKRKGKKGRTIEIKANRRSQGLRLAQLVLKLELSDEQRAAVVKLHKDSQTALDDSAGDPEKRKASTVAAVTEIAKVFPSDDFDAATLGVFPEEPAGDLEKQVSTRVDQVQRLLDILTEEQRAELSSRILNSGGAAVNPDPGGNPRPAGKRHR